MRPRSHIITTHGALQLHAYLVHCIAYGGPLTCSPNYGKTSWRMQLFMYPRLREGS